MCGRFSLSTPREDLRKQFDLFTVPDLPPRYNITPGTPIGVVRATPEGRTLDPVRWGLIPSWAKDASIGNKLANARAETLQEKPSFRGAFRQRRCLVPADGWYEWKKIPSGKEPWYFSRVDGTPVALGGLWERWQEPETGAWVDTCCLITTEPNPLAAEVHDRMPVIITPDHWETWLAPKSRPDVLLPLLQPIPSEGLRVWRVGSQVNNPRVDDPRCIEAVE